MSDNLKQISSKLAGGTIRTAGRIEFVRDQGPIRRNIRTQNFEWSSDRLRELSKILWACERSHSYAIAGLRLFSRMPASDFSPDGLLGGVGYIQSIKDMRSALGNSIELVSNFCDTLHDEINGAHWVAALEDSDVQNIMMDVEEVKANPDDFVETQYDEEVDAEEPLEITNPQPNNPVIEDPSNDEEEEDDGGWGDLYSPVSSKNKLRPVSEENSDEPHSELPSDDSIQEEALSDVERVVNTTWAMPPGNYASAIKKVPEQLELKKMASRIANSSVPVETLPGPRVDSIGPAEGGEHGYFNGPEDWPSDDPSGEGFNSDVYIYQGDDANPDGTSGYSHPTDGDVTSLRASKVGYSWLPGSRNEKPLNFYDRSLSEEDLNWMRANDDPDPPEGMVEKRPAPFIDPLYNRMV